MTSKKNRLINHLVYSRYISKIAGESALLEVAQSVLRGTDEMAPMGTDLTPGKTTGWLESKSD